MTASTSTILLPVDGSDCSTRAAAHAAMLARALGWSVLLLNVQPEVQDWQTHGIGREAALEHHARLAKAALEAATRQLSDSGVAFESLIRHGEVAETIASVTAERGCACVVMGTQGPGELRGMLLGSVSLKLIHLVTVPITLVH